jgi:hypothetical protein
MPERHEPQEKPSGRRNERSAVHRRQGKNSLCYRLRWEKRGRGLFLEWLKKSVKSGHRAVAGVKEALLPKWGTHAMSRLRTGTQARYH